MLERFCSLFIKDSTNLQDPKVRRAYGMLVSVIGIVINLLLSVGKLTVGLLFASVAIQADAINNVSDAGSALIALICFRISAKPADRDHPFGHARVEYVASMIVSFLVLLVGFELFTSSATALYQSIFQPQAYTAPVFSVASVIVLSLSILGKLFLAALNSAVGKRISSGVMRAAATDSLSDVISTAAVLAATLLAHFVPLPFSLDGAVGILVSVFILVAGGKILWETQNSILGEAPDPETVARITELVRSYPEALGIHDLVVHHYGAGCTMASLHVEVDGARDVFETHDAIDNMERRLWEELHVRASVHLDPIVVGDPVVDELRALTARLAASLYEGITVHDFRLVRGTTHSNLIFDLAVPFECPLADREVAAQTEALLRAENDLYRTVITIDRV